MPVTNLKPGKALYLYSGEVRFECWLEHIL